MSDHIVIFGSYDEILVVAERIVSAQGIPSVDRAGREVLPPAYEHAKFGGSMVGLDNGTTIQVPHTPDEVMHRRREAMMRQGMLP